MYGLFLRALQGHAETTFGPARWADVMQRAGVMPRGFEPLLAYDSAMFQRVVTAAGAVLDRPVASLLEDVGTYVVTNPNLPAVRRLLRFGGADFVDFLFSLDELADRARLALPDVDFPSLHLDDQGHGAYLLHCRTELAELAHIMLGVLRSMADDYGALVLIEPLPNETDSPPILSIRVLDARFSEGKRFDLAKAG